MKKKIPKIKIISFIISFLPAVNFAFKYLRGSFLVYPVLELTKFSGRMAIIFLLISLACTPIRIILKLNSMILARKILGLASFLYALLHAFSFLILDYQLNLDWLLIEFTEKPYLLLGLFGFILLLILAITSLRIYQIKNPKLWIKIHKLVYLISAMVLLHNYVAIKGDKTRALLYILIFALMMVIRIPFIKNMFDYKPSRTMKFFDTWFKS